LKHIFASAITHLRRTARISVSTSGNDGSIGSGSGLSIMGSSSCVPLVLDASSVLARFRFTAAAVALEIPGEGDSGVAMPFAAGETAIAGMVEPKPVEGAYGDGLDGGTRWMSRW
jgi:hypothetical protein